MAAHASDTGRHQRRAASGQPHAAMPCARPVAGPAIRRAAGHSAGGPAAPATVGAPVAGRPHAAAHRARRREAATLALAFLLPVCAFVISCAANGICPFGETSFLRGDLDYQYVDFFTWFRRVLTGQASLFYSFAPSLGTNTWGLYSYYTASPFCLLTLFFDEAHMTECAWLMSALKLGLMGLASAWYARRRFRLPRPWTLALALSYALSSWVVAQLSNLMWLDALVLLPLVSLGIWRHVRERRWGLLVAATSATIVSCWYMGYMVVLFSLFMLALELIAARASWREACQAAVRHAAALALVIPLSAWTFFPTLAAMAAPWRPLKTAALVVAALIMLAASLLVLRRGLGERVYSCLGTPLLLGIPAVAVGLVVYLSCAHGLSTPRALFTCTLGDFLRGLTPLAAMADVRPQLWCGFVCLLALVALPLCRRLSPRVRLGIAVVLACWLLSIMLRAGQYVWCGLRAPNGWYSRPAAFAAMLAVWVAGFVLSSSGPSRPSKPCVPSGAIKASKPCVSSGASTSCVSSGPSKASTPCVSSGPSRASKPCVSSGPSRPSEPYMSSGASKASKPCVSSEPHMSSAPSASIPTASAPTCPAASPASPRHRALGWAALALTFLELTLASTLAMGTLYRVSEPNTKAYIQASRAQLAQLTAHDATAYRLDKTYNRHTAASLNEGLARGFNQLSSYTSVSNQAAVGALNALGYSNPGEFSTRYAWPNLVADSLLGVKYAAVREAQAPAGYALTSVPATEQGERVYQNPYALSLGYAATPATAALSLTGTDPFTAQNQLLQAITGEQDAAVYEPLEPTIAAEDATSRTYEVEVPANSIGYVYLQSYTGTGYVLMVNSNEPVTDGVRFRHATYDLGEPSATPRTCTVKLITTDGSPLPADVTLAFAELNESHATQVLTHIAEHQLAVEQLGSASLAGTYEAEQGGYLLLSIPADAGWSIRINGEAAQAQPALGGAMTLVQVEEGTNKLEMSYRPSALVAGCVVTLLACALCACLRPRPCATI